MNKMEEMDIRRKWAVTGIRVVFVLFTKAIPHRKVGAILPEVI